MTEINYVVATLCALVFILMMSCSQLNRRVRALEKKVGLNSWGELR